MTSEAGENPLAGEVSRLKTVLTAIPRPAVGEMRDALTALRKLGALPDTVLSLTKIGMVLSKLAKDVEVASEVSREARSLVEDWKQAHRKRKVACDADKTGVSDPVTPPAKRSAIAVGAPGAQQSVVQSLSAQREKVRQKISEAMGVDSELVRGGMDSLIEEALHSQLDDREYKSHARSIIFNMKDSSVGSLRHRLASGSVKPDMLPRMAVEELASDSKAAERARAREEALKIAAVKGEEERVTDAYTCGKCGGKRCTYVIVTPPSCVNGEHSWTNVTCLTCNYRWKA